MQAESGSATWRARLDWLAGIAMLVAAVLLIVVAVRAIQIPPGPSVTRKVEEPLPTGPVSLVGAALAGAIDARAALIVFSDFECPYCGRFARDVMPTIQREFVSTGLVRVAFRHYPLSKIHPRATAAAEAAECAGRQGQFWPMHDRLFEIPMDLSPDRLLERGFGLGLDKGAFKECLGGLTTARIIDDLALGTKLGVRGTPTVLVGTTSSGDSVMISDRFSGAPSVTALSRAIRTALQLAAR